MSVAAAPLAVAWLAISAAGSGRLSPAIRPYHQPRAAVVLSDAADASSIQLSVNDPRLVTVSLDRVTGIDFGCDLSLRWPYVLAFTPGGAAERQGELRIGDQLLAVQGDSVIGQPIASAMERVAAAEGGEIEMLFFRGSRESLQALCAVAQGPATISLTVQRAGQADQVRVRIAPFPRGASRRRHSYAGADNWPGPAQTFEVPYGSNLRDELVSRGVNVYQSVTRWTNCNGKQLCGTCIVDLVQGIEGCTRRSVDEASTLRENPETYKLACITNLYGDVTVKVLPKIGAAQWTR